MKNKKFIPLICLMIGVVLIVVCLIGKGLEIFDTYKALFGIMLGIGSGLFGGGLGQLVSVIMLEKDPALKKKKEIETSDERNVYINNKAKAKAFDIMGYTLPIAMFTQILLGVDFIITIIMLVSYFIIYATLIYYLNKYSKEM
jgi:hypothetical protein